jgi:hypothetical protein
MMRKPLSAATWPQISWIRFRLVAHLAEILVAHGHDFTAKYGLVKMERLARLATEVEVGDSADSGWFH